MKKQQLEPRICIFTKCVNGRDEHVIKPHSTFCVCSSYLLDKKLCGRTLILDDLDFKMLKRVSSDSKVFNILLKIDDKECKSQNTDTCKSNLPDNVLRQITLVHNVCLFPLKSVKESMESSIKHDLK